MARILILLCVTGFLFSSALAYSVAEKEPVPVTSVPDVDQNDEAKTEVADDAAAVTDVPVPSVTEIISEKYRKEPEAPLPPDYGRNTTAPPPVIDSDKIAVKIDKDQVVAIITGKPDTRQQENCVCGTPITKIVNGEAALIKDYPWTVGLLRKGFLGFGGSSKPFCGGTLINDRYIVTASHCVDGQVPNSLQVLINEQDLTTTTEADTQKFAVDKIIMHEGYSRQTIDNDIALIRLATPINLANKFVNPACLPANNDNDFSGLNATAAGWGTTDQGGSQSPILLKVEVPVITNEVCNSEQTKYKGKISPNMLCAGILGVGGKDACQGDSGGPLTIPNGGRTTLVGVVSWGYGCAKADSPGVYTRVARYPDWILKNTADATWCS